MVEYVFFILLLLRVLPLDVFVSTFDIYSNLTTGLNILSLSSGLNKEDHMVIAHRLGEMEKRRVGTRFIEREATEEDHAKPLVMVMQEKLQECKIM